MRQLHPRHRALRFNEMENARQHLDLRVFPDAEIVRADPSLFQDRGRLGENERRPADGAAAEMHQMPVVGEAIGAGILAHRRDDDAVAKKHFAHLQRREQVSVLMCKHAKESHRMRNSFGAMRAPFLAIASAVVSSRADAEDGAGFPDLVDLRRRRNKWNPPDLSEKNLHKPQRILLTV